MTMILAPGVPADAAQAVTIGVLGGWGRASSKLGTIGKECAFGPPSKGFSADLGPHGFGAAGFLVALAACF